MSSRGSGAKRPARAASEPWCGGDRLPRSTHVTVGVRAAARALELAPDDLVEVVARVQAGQKVPDPCLSAHAQPILAEPLVIPSGRRPRAARSPFPIPDGRASGGR